LEKLNIVHRLNFTRFAYHTAVGRFNIRNEKDNIQITEEYIDHVLIRIYKPLNQTIRKSHNENLLPTILYYHGGGYFLGSAGIILYLYC
jgi:acetyl esterase/lipase